MKKFTFVIVVAFLFLALNQHVYSQISRQEAINYVMDSIVGDQIDSVNIYLEPDLLNNSYYKIGLEDSIYSPYSSWWLFFVDDKPFVLNWEHDCRYIIVDSMTGNHVKYNHTIQPFNYKFHLDTVSITYQFQIPTVDLSKNQTSSTTDNEHLYAVLFGVDGCWHAFSHLYSALREQGYPRENIYVLFNDGKTTNPYMISPDLDNDGINDILDKLCSEDNLKDIFETLEDKMKSDDLLFIYSNSHGEKGNFNNETRLKLWGGDLVYDYELESMVQSIEYSELIYIVHSCNAGGFKDNFDGENQTVICLVEWGIPYGGDYHTFENTGMQPFDYGVVTAIRGYHPDSKTNPWNKDEPIGDYDNLSSLIKTLDESEEDFDPDAIGNNDNTFQILEIIDYADFIDKQFPTFGVHNYNSGFDETDDLLSLTGLSGTINTTQTVDGNFLVGGDLTLAQGTTLTVDNSSKFFFANGDFTTASGSQLSLGSNVSFKNYQTLSTFDFNGGVTFNTGGSFKSIENTTLKLRLDNQLLQANFVNNSFENCDIHSYASSLTANGSTFTNCEMIYSYRGAIDISNNCQFINSGLYLENADQDNDNVSITNSSFTTNQNLLGISLWSYDYFTVSNNTFSDYYDGIQVMQTGQGIPTTRTISGNTISGSTNAGIVTFNSGVNIAENTIQNNNDGIRVLNNSTVSIQGNPSAQNYSEMNLIQNNDRYEVYSSTGSFPWYFRYNAIFDTDNNGNPEDPHIYYQPSGTMQTLDVRYNCWDGSFSPNQDLYPVGSYLYGPTWCPPGANKSSDIVLQAYLDGLEHFENEEFADARETFEEVIEQYPQTQYAPAAMKELLAVEKVDGNNYTQLQQYYSTDDSVQAYPDLVKLAGYLSNQCELAMENWQTAIDYFEDIIENPDSPEDSIFAIIDLGYTYFLMENSGQKSSAKGSMLQHKPINMKSFTAKRDTLLAMLPFTKSTEKTNEDLTSEKIGELSQNVPNPFRDNTQISYHLIAESNVELYIYNYSGQLIKTINEGRKTQGTHSINFNASGFRSGIYFYSISVNGRISDLKKMTVIN